MPHSLAATAGCALTQIRDALCEVERGKLSLDWQGLSRQVRAPWSTDGAVLLEEAELHARVCGLDRRARQPVAGQAGSPPVLWVEVVPALKCRCPRKWSARYGRRSASPILVSLKPCFQ